MIKKINQHMLKIKIEDEKEKLTDEGALKSVFRASATGKCIRQLWYQLHKTPTDLLVRVEKEGIDKVLEEDFILGRSYLVFDMGHKVEKQLVDIALQEFETFKAFSDNNKQEEIIINLGEHIFTGHLDGQMRVDDKQQNELMIIDFKSTNEANFKYRLPKGEIGYDYVCQANMYMKGTDTRIFKFVYYNKNTSHLYEHIERYNPNIISEIKNKYDRLEGCNKPPERAMLSTTKNNILQYPCTYCSYKLQCLKGMYSRERDAKGKYIEIVKGG
jgi:hypothetical protein